MTTPAPIEVFIPDTAPFTEQQRAWLNGFVAGLLGMERMQRAPASLLPPAPVEATTAVAEDAALARPDAVARRADVARGRSPARRALDGGDGSTRLRPMRIPVRVLCGRAGHGSRGRCWASVFRAAGRPRRMLKDCWCRSAEPPRDVRVARRFAARSSAATAATRRCRARLMVSHVAVRAGGREGHPPRRPRHRRRVTCRYAPGDSLGIWPHNNPDEVELLLAILQGDAARRR